MRMVLLTLAVLAGLGLTGAAAVIGLGLYNVSAHAGHWPGVSWVLHTTFRSAVKLRAPSMEEVPPLDDPDLIALGAGHYATACAMCHGAPGQPRSATIRAMVPEPPEIAEAVKDWQPNELHWIVQNGVKMSGMPGWPVTERPDEVWSVVAWLMTVQGGTPSPVPQATDGEGYCRTCHGTVAGPVPRLDILGSDYIADQLAAYRSGLRPSGIMAQAMSMVPEDQDAELSAALSTRGAGDGPSGSGMADSRGSTLAAKGSRDVPACVACHGADASKGPRLAGQNEAYIADQLHLWRDGVLDHNKLMAAAAVELTDQDIADLAAYFSGR